MPASTETAAPARPRFFADFATVLGGQVANILVAFMTEVCFARLLGPGPRGQISLCLMAIWFGALFGGLGGEVPIVILSAAHRKKPPRWISTIFVWGLMGSGIAVTLWTLVYSRWHSSLLRGMTPGLAKIVLIGIPAGVLFNYLMAFLLGAERFRVRAGLGVFEGTAALSGFLILCWLYGRNADAAMWGNCFGLLVGVVAGAVLLRGTLQSGNWNIAKPDKEARSLLLVGLYGNVGNISSFFNYRLDVFIVNYFLNTAQLGIYAVGVAVSESLWQIPQAAATALFPRTARTVEGDATKFTCLIVRQVLVISCLSGILLASVSPIAIPLVFGARFAPSVPVIWWILPGTISLALGKVAASDLAGRHKTFYTSIFGVISLVITVALDLILIPRMGIQGAALASSVAYGVYGVLLLAALRYELNVKWGSLLVPSRLELARYKEAVSALFARRAISSASS